MDNSHRLLLIGVDDDEYRWVLDNFVDFLGRQGISVEKKGPHPQPDAADAKAALNDEDMRRKNASWIREIPEKTLASVLEHPEKRSEKIWGYSVTFEADWNKVTHAIDSLPNKLETAEAIILLPDQASPHKTPDMEYQPDPPKNPNAPFSYDPAQDYYTEPDRQ